mgnify:CR=1 FL=1
MWKSRICRVCKKVYLSTGPKSFYCSFCRKLKKREWNKKFKQSPRGKISEKKWNNSEKCRANIKKYRTTKRYKEYSKKRYDNMDINIKKARYYVHNAIRDGKLIKPNYCSRCLTKDWGKKRSMIESHHYKGYEPQNWLSVQWLCTNCHKEVDAR